MKTRLIRFVTVIGGLAVVALPAVATSSSFRGYLDHHAGVAVYVTLGTPIALAAYRELVAWRNKPKPVK